MVCGVALPSDVIPDERSGDPGSRAADEGFDGRAGELAAGECRREEQLSLR
ncbi:hypothetical protein [Pseudovibrio ascidiaceicola]|uniref:hypothetical protein n=1 Tax=Pseudovibrio ascidiaceicola TaxID=285279 RepID=UPI001AD7EF25|nr:hypothetical protein [Pseudovibrio ascidiaceicola]